MGGSRLSRRRYSWPWSRAVEQDDTRRRQARAPEDFRGEHQKFYILGGYASTASGFQAAASGFVGIEVAPLPAILNDDAQMAWPTADTESRPRHTHQYRLHTLSMQK